MAVLQVCKGQQQHEEVCLGLFTLVLTEPPQAQRVSLRPYLDPPGDLFLSSL